MLVCVRSRFCCVRFSRLGHAVLLSNAGATAENFSRD